jgi:hypothetical protein
MANLKTSMSFIMSSQRARWDYLVLPFALARLEIGEWPGMAVFD